MLWPRMSADLKVHKATGKETEQRAAKHILPALGKIRLSDLTSTQLTRWRDALAEQPALIRARPGAPQNYRPAPTTAEGMRAREQQQTVCGPSYVLH